MTSFSVDQYLGEDVEFATRDEAIDQLSKKASEFGGEHIAYGILNPGMSSPRLAFDAITTYSPAWLERYFSQSYHIQDPILKTASSSRCPFDWETAKYDSTPLKTFFGESVEHGLGRQGFAIPIHGPNGEMCALSFNADVSDRDWIKMRQEVLPHIMLFAHQFNEKALNIRKPKLPESTLSPRESEALKWAAEGKSVWETSRILGISDHSVKSYLQNAQRKLACCNKLHTVVTAVRLGII
ncbi:LuxR family transcriptional regulator [uncultured Maritalea sp.]|uniref:helix-turn-helix transcriptional regulator n=1 Tax=uncultured Maritalea sp. TaxID=757249 RepID=UPI002609D5EE|nr:LuxR family transcriptional regulator [uncultured Maritalea sp.]